MAIIGLDATYLSIYGKGVSRHQYNLIKSLSKLDKKNCYYVFINKKNILPDLPAQENFHYVRVCIPKRIIWDQFQLPFIVMKYKLDIYYSLNDTLPFFGRGKFVLFLFEIPDYRIELARHSGNNFLYARLSHGYNRLCFRPSLRKAKVIIASSNSTKKDLIERYNVNEKKIQVIYSAAEECFRAAIDDKGLFNTRKKYDAEAGYILHISSSDPRDNTPAVIRAYQKTLPNLKTPKKLIICGGIDPEEPGLRKLITESNLEKSIIFTGHLSLLSEELVALYQAADLYVDMSLYEGFGFQVVEAMSCGIPVITSSVTSLPEIMGGSGILVSPTDIDSLAFAIIMVLTDSGLREALRQRSLERAKFFSWEKTARETLAIYDALLAEPVTLRKKVIVFLRGLFYNPRLDWYKINFNLFPIRGKILDVGCARGPFIDLAPARIVGLDWNRQGLKECVNKAYKVINADALKLPFRDQSFEGIHCADLIEHFSPQDARRLINEMLRTIKVGGFLVIATPLLSKAFWEDAFHVRPYPPYSLLSYCVGNTEQGIGIQTNHESLPHNNAKFVKLILRYTSFYQLPLHLYFREDRMKLSNLIRPSSLLFMLSNLLYRIGLKDPRPEGYVLLLQKV